MPSSADMLIAHCIIAVDAMAWDAPPRRSANATKMAKNRRADPRFSMRGTLSTPQIAVKYESTNCP